MHYCAQIHIHSTDNVKEQITKIMAPHREDWSDEERPRGFWDWWQIGGRWSGIGTNYDPEKDPENLEAKGAKWPTEWREALEHNVKPVASIPDDLSCYTLIVGDRVLHKEEWTGKEWKDGEFDGKVKLALERMGVKDGFLVTVDYHS